MTLIAFIITSVKYHLKLSSGKYLLPMISLKCTLYNYLLYGADHGLKNNTRLTRFCDPTKKKSLRSRAIFGLNDRKSGVNRHLRFYPFPKNSEMCRVWVHIIHLTMSHTRHLSELKYAPTHCTFQIFGGNG